MAPPSRSRVSGPSSGQSRGGPTPLPTYQPLQHPLTDSAQRALEKLPRDHRLDTLKEKLRVANHQLTVAAADVNDRLHIQNENYSKQKKRLEKQQDSQESTGELDAKMAEAQDQTDTMTARLEVGVRKVIDIGADVESMERALKELQEKVSEGGGRVVPTQSTLGASYNRPARRGGRRENDSDDGSEDDNSAQAIGEDESITVVLKRKLADQQSTYQAMSMAERYASHNDYIGFKKIVHDAQHPSDSAPPMPHASTWFPSNSPSDPTNTNNDTTTTSTLANTRNKNKHTNNTTNSEVPPSPTSSEDLAVASERISIKCPLTLLTMKDPVTSQKCPHSFEKEAILGMIAASDVYVGGNGGGRRGGGQKAMKCPVCEVLLTGSDLQANPILVRKIKRIQAAAQNAQNEDHTSFSHSSDDDDGRPSIFGNSKRPTTITSSPLATRRTPRMKSERQKSLAASSRQSLAPSSRQSRQVSMVPNSQVEPSQIEASQVVDLEDEDE